MASASFIACSLVRLSLALLHLLLLWHILPLITPQNDNDLTDNTRRDIHQRRAASLRDTMFATDARERRPPDRTYNINVTLSERTSLLRSVPDTRPPGCAALRYQSDALPSVSVVMVFYNEALSILLRSLHSVLQRTPAALLRDVVLVDDHSVNSDLRTPLERYLRHLVPVSGGVVRLVRTKRREGLMRARMIGARLSSGDVLYFQDAHVEVNVDWVQPLLHEILQDERAIVQPTVDMVDASTLKYEGNPFRDAVPRGGFSWDLRYVWMQMPDHERTRLAGDPIRPHRTPTLVGCALAVHRRHFRRLGGFDADLDVWGGENLELAMRNWMCGAGAARLDHPRTNQTLTQRVHVTERDDVNAPVDIGDAAPVLTVPCSRVAHVFKPFSYAFDGDREKIVQRNLLRVAALHLDAAHARFFQAATYSWRWKRTFLTGAERRRLHARRRFLRRLGCRSFAWYMRNVIPEVPSPPEDAVYYGEVHNERTERCLSVADDDGYLVMSSLCYFHRVIPANLFYIDTNGRLKHQTPGAKPRCVYTDAATYLLRAADCEAAPTPGLINAKWRVVGPGFTNEVTTGQLRATSSLGERCVSHVTNAAKPHQGEQVAQLTDCPSAGTKNAYSSWRWTYKFNFDYDFGEI